MINGGNYVRYNYEGVEKQAVRLKLQNGMWLNVSVPVSEINGGWVSMVTKILIVSAILLIVFILVAMQFAGYITKPLRELTRAAEQVNAGNYDIELELHRKDEVGILSNTFNDLIRNIKGYISELNILNDRLKEDNLILEAATTKDSLTGVKNRFALRRDYEKYIDIDIHIMMLDIDDFKGVNDKYGHSVGDYLLKQTGNALIDNFGIEYSYRYGGDEFMVIVPDIDETGFKEKITALEKQLSDIQLSDRKMYVQFSAGYVFGKIVLNDDLRLMLRQSDEILYKVKAAGKNNFIGQEYDRTYAEGLQKRAEEAFRHG